MHTPRSSQEIAAEITKLSGLLRDFSGSDRDAVLVRAKILRALASLRGETEIPPGLSYDELVVGVTAKRWCEGSSDEIPSAHYNLQSWKVERAKWGNRLTRTGQVMATKTASLVPGILRIRMLPKRKVAISQLNSAS